MSQYTCVACQEEDLENHISLPCGKHAYCIDCMKGAVQVAINDEQYYPLRCSALECDPIPDDLIHDCLAEKDSAARNLLETFETKAQEYSVPASARTYCANAKCLAALGHSRYIHHEVSGSENRVICPDCSGITCRYCKASIAGMAEHACEETEDDQIMKDYIETLPEDERWLCKKCYSCGVWIDKTEACNHMTCGAEFCLVCGRPWEDLISCRWGCPKMEAPVYDDEGFNQLGFHPETGLNREGNPWNPNHEHEGWEQDQGWADDELDDDDEFIRVFDEEGYDQEGFDIYGYDREGFDESGWDREGFDREGFDWWGFNRDRIDREGFNEWGSNAEGYDRNGLDKTGRDANGFFEDGFDMDGFDANNISLRNLHRDYYDEEGYATFGFDVFGFSRAGLDVEGYGTDGYNLEGYDRDGFDEKGYDAAGYDREGYDEHGRNSNGLTADGFNQHHRNADGEIQPGFYPGPDGNLRQIIDGGPKAEVLDCKHSTIFTRGSATCSKCEWTSDVFYHGCVDCDTKLCRDCKNKGSERRNKEIREKYPPWSGSDSYGIREMFEEMFARMERAAAFEEAAECSKDWPPIRRHSISHI